MFGLHLDTMATRKYVDDYLHLGHRRRLVQQLRARGITDERVLAAIGKVPRHWFVAQPYEALAYEDRALPIASGQTISQPYTVAYQSALLQTEPRMKVLEVGTGSGYQAAVLGALDLRVYSLERHTGLYQSARHLLTGTRFGKIRCFLRDGYRGLPVYGPYDRILVTAGAPELPLTLLDQLAQGGQLVIPVGGIQQTMQRVTRTGKGPTDYTIESFAKFRFVPFKPGLAGAGERVRLEDGQS